MEITANIATPTVWTPQAHRDNDPDVDIGYHYDPIDYVSSAKTVSAPLTLNNGVVLGTYGALYYPGLTLAAGGSFNSQGTATNLNWIVRYNTVQEQSTMVWSASTVAGSLAMGSSATPVAAGFTGWSLPAGIGNHFYNSLAGAPASVFTSCQFFGGKFTINPGSVFLTNCLWHRVDLLLRDNTEEVEWYLYNNLFYGGRLQYKVIGEYTIPVAKDNFFDRIILMRNAGSEYFIHDYNGYIAGQSRLAPGRAAHDAPDVANMTYLVGTFGSFYQTAGSHLLDRGSRLAADAGLFYYTTQTSVAREGSSQVDIGFHYPVDVDNDGLDDVWETQHGLNPDLASGLDGAYGDPDGDGLSNLQEYTAGSSPVENDGLANPLALPPVGARYLRIISPTLLELVRLVSHAENSTIWNYTADNLPSGFQVLADGQPYSVQGVSFKQRPLFDDYALQKNVPGASDTRVEKAIYLKLNSELPLSVRTVEVRNVPASEGMQFVASNDGLRYSPAIHVSQDGYLATQPANFPKIARVGYYTGNPAHEMDLGATLPAFHLTDAATGQIITDPNASGTLALSADVSSTWNTGEAEYQKVYRADFSNFTTPGKYRLRVEGLGVSLPFAIDNNSPMKWARAYALGLYHQRCGHGAGTIRVNDIPYTRFVHGDCHLQPVYLPRYVPANPLDDYPDTIVVNTHNQKLNESSAENTFSYQQQAQRLSDFNKSLYPFRESATRDASLGHHDAGDYGKYVINSAALIEILAFAADQFPGVAALDNLGIPESGDGISDVLQEAKWEADFLMKMQDRGNVPGQPTTPDGGFNFLVYPLTGRYESSTPDRGQRQVHWPKNTAVTAAAVAALAEIGSSPKFLQQFGLAAPTSGNRYPNIYLQRAKDGWDFLIRQIGNDNANYSTTYQAMTHYGNDYAHDDELAWAAAAMFAATGDAVYSGKLMTWFPNPTDQNLRWSTWWRLYASYGAAVRAYAFFQRSATGLSRYSQLINGGVTPVVNTGYASACQNEMVAAGNDWTTWSGQNAYGTSMSPNTKQYGQPGWYFSTDFAFEIAVAQQLQPSADYLKAIVANFNYQHGCNPVNVDFVTGLGSRRQRTIVNQYANFPDYDQRMLPPSGLVLGNLAHLITPEDGYPPLNVYFYPPTAGSSGPASFNLYDRWADVHNVSAEGVILEPARALAVAAYLNHLAAPANESQSWRSAAGVITPLSTVQAGTPVTVRLDSDTVDLSAADIVWDVEGESQPVFGRTVQITARAVSQALVEAEAVLPDGRRVFGRTYLQLNDRANGGTEFGLDPNNTAALYHFNAPGSVITPSPTAFPAAPNNYVTISLQAGKAYIFTLGPNCSRIEAGTSPNSILCPSTITPGPEITFNSPESSAKVWGTPGAPYDGTMRLTLPDDTTHGHAFAVTRGAARGENISWMSGTPAGASVRFRGPGDEITVEGIPDSAVRGSGFEVDFRIFIKAIPDPARQAGVPATAHVFQFIENGDTGIQWTFWYATFTGYQRPIFYVGETAKTTDAEWDTYMTPNHWHDVRLTVLPLGGGNYRTTLAVDGAAGHTWTWDAAQSFITGGTWSLKFGNVVGDVDEVRVQKMP